MTTQTNIQTKPTFNQSQITIGIVLLVIGLLMFLLFVRDTQPGQQATFGLNTNSGNEAFVVPDLVLPVQPSLYVLTVVIVFLAGWQFARGIRSTGLLVGVVAFAFVASFLIWATKDQAFNLVGMLGNSLIGSHPRCPGCPMRRDQ